ncbi:MAG: DUF4265 domain-containing protein [Pseudomonadota bacterium]
MKADSMTKVVFRVEAEDGSIDVETSWATQVGDDEYRIENSLFFAYGVSWQDIVRAPFSPEEERPTFESVVRKSGHRTIRAIFDPPIADGNASEVVLSAVVGMGCSYEGANHSYICIDIPPNVDFGAVRQFLMEKNINFEHADPTYDELFPEGGHAA